MMHARQEIIAAESRYSGREGTGLINIPVLYEIVERASK
jgi:hypothetical protein